MIYLNEEDIKNIGINWDELFSKIEEALKCLSQNDFAQPIKPYLRYRDLRNRIIAMPAFVGGDFNIAGIKWIASFPNNIQKNIPRAHSVVILNNAETGEPVCIINTGLLSIIRTASVTGVMIKHFDKVRPLQGIKLGIIGWGPIGQYHFKMCTQALKEKISGIYLFDLRPINKETIDFPEQDKIHIAQNWQEVYANSDVLITCTVSSQPYIDQEPKTGSLLLNVSLRDFKTNIYDYVKNSIIVDDWDEVCREKTDIEMMHLEKGLQKEDTRTLADVIMDGGMKSYGPTEPIMFNPMGMAVFDMATGCYYMRKALELGIGKRI